MCHVLNAGHGKRRTVSTEEQMQRGNFGCVRHLAINDQCSDCEFAERAYQLGLSKGREEAAGLADECPGALIDVDGETLSLGQAIRGLRP